jgi:DNA-binding beta-propeller fold protein YncE
MVKEFLDRRSVAVEVLDATTVDSMAFLRGLGRLAAPVVVVGDVIVAGHDPVRLEAVLREAELLGDDRVPVQRSNHPALPADLNRPHLWVAAFLDDALGVLDIGTGRPLTAAGSDDGARVPVGLKPMSLLHDPVTDWLWITNFESSSVTRLEAATGRYVGGSLEAATTPTEASPSDLVLDPGRRRVLVSCSSSEHLVVLDADSGLAARPPVHVGRMPTAMAIVEENEVLFVRAADDIVVLDTESLEPMSEDLTGAERVTGRTLALDVDRSRLYVPVDETHVAAIDARVRSAVGRSDAERIATARVPFMMLHDVRHGLLFVSCVGDRVLQAIDTATATVVATVGTGGGARGLALDSDASSLYVTCFEDSVVQVLDPATLSPRHGSIEASTFTTPPGPRGCLTA